MLLDIDHIACSSMQFNKHIEIMKSLDYQPEFLEKNVKNLSIKRPLLNIFSEVHDIVLLKSKGNLSLEFLNHRNIHISEPYIMPVFENLPSKFIEKLDKEKFNEIGVLAKMKFFDIPIYVNNETTRTGFKFNKLVINSQNVLKTNEFFKALGFKELLCENDFCKLEFRSVFGAGVYYIYLKKSQKRTSLRYLDDSGPNCLAFISNSTEKEKEILDKENFFTTPIQHITLNKKLMKIFFSKGPENEIIEIISL